MSMHVYAVCICWFILYSAYDLLTSVCAQVLILCPMRHMAYEIVCTMKALLGSKASFLHEERFEEEYGPADEDDNSDDDTSAPQV